jgi:RimJ/RimL family protein N-acetyltransferase
MKQMADNESENGLSGGTDPAALRVLFAGQEHQLAVQAVLAGAAQGQVFVDDAGDPRAAILWVQHRVFLAGSPEDAATVAALRQLLANVIAPAARERGDYAFGLYYPPAWHSHLDVLLPDLPHMALERQYYVAERLDRLPSSQEQLPPGLRLAAVDAALLARTELGNYARLAEETCSERPSVEDFLQRSFGVCLLDGDTLAGWCLSEYNCADRCEVGIEAVEEYQRRGLGALMTLALCEEAARRGLRHVGWHCLANNVPSGATARKAGLRLALEYPAAVVWLTAE